jgi:DNA-directed RNA polymerase sigma subunit (sigma70/sigma32)
MLRDKVFDVLANATVEDEEITEEESQSAARSRKWFKNNQGSSLEDVAAELGFSMDQIRKGDAPA